VARAAPAVLSDRIHTQNPRVPRLSNKEHTVSESNGDKARFSRERKKKALKRKTNWELRKTLGITTKAPKAA
jgi:hypothetical protein